jgi:hypothetical protein
MIYSKDNKIYTQNNMIVSGNAGGSCCCTYKKLRNCSDNYLNDFGLSKATIDSLNVTSATSLKINNICFYLDSTWTTTKPGTVYTAANVTKYNCCSACISGGTCYYVYLTRCTDNVTSTTYGMTYSEFVAFATYYGRYARFNGDGYWFASNPSTSTTIPPVLLHTSDIDATVYSCCKQAAFGGLCAECCGNGVYTPNNFLGVITGYTACSGCVGTGSSPASLRVQTAGDMNGTYHFAYDATHSDSSKCVWKAPIANPQTIGVYLSANCSQYDHSYTQSYLYVVNYYSANMFYIQDDINWPYGSYGWMMTPFRVLKLDGAQCGGGTFNNDNGNCGYRTEPVGSSIIMSGHGGAISLVPDGY